MLNFSGKQFKYYKKTSGKIRFSAPRKISDCRILLKFSGCLKGTNTSKYVVNTQFWKYSFFSFPTGYRSLFWKYRKSTSPRFQKKGSRLSSFLFFYTYLFFICFTWPSTSVCSNFEQWAPQATDFTFLQIETYLSATVR